MFTVWIVPGLYIELKQLQANALKPEQASLFPIWSSELDSISQANRILD